MAFAGAEAPSNAMLPKVWMSAKGLPDMEETIRMCAEQGVDCVEVPTRQEEDCARSLAALRKYGIRGFTGSGPDPSMDSRPAVRDGAPCERAVCVAGAYRGLAIDRNLFAFAAGPHEIVVEPPVYSKGQPYTRRKKDADGTERVVKSGHYFGSLRPTGKAEIIVPECLFDGEQHLRVIPCEVLPAGPDEKPENDTAVDMSGPEIENRRLVKLRFDLTDCAGLMLDKVGIAVYWESDPDGSSWKNGSGQLSVFSELTRERARHCGRWRANQWALANGGAFPAEEIVAIRFGDECFNITGWLDSPAASVPAWGFSDSGRAAFEAAATNSSLTGAAHAAPVQPRTLGFPEIYGTGAYGVALYVFHEACAGLVRAFREGVREVSPDFLVFRNTTRADVWSEANDRDGSGQELLARELDFLHIDPYPIYAGTYATDAIPRDMGYMSGLARRFGKPLIPWMQAHAYAPSGMGDITPADMKRMWAQHLPFEPSGMMWLGFDANPGNSDTEMTFPKRSPKSWAYAKELFAEVHCGMSERGLPARGMPELAIVRPYSTRATRCATAGGWRNPADCHLAAFALAWGVDNGLQYDVFELPPAGGAGGKAPRLLSELSRYPLVVTTVPLPGVPAARVLGAGTDGTILDLAGFNALRKAFAAEIAAARAADAGGKSK